MRRASHAVNAGGEIARAVRTDGGGTGYTPTNGDGTTSQHLQPCEQQQKKKKDWWRHAGRAAWAGTAES